MLFILTGDIQIGKTRWLKSTCRKLAADGIPCAGVVAPGVWVPSEHGDANGFEKLGIDNLLLPQGERIPFARRRDLRRPRERSTRTAKARRCSWDGKSPTMR